MTNLLVLSIALTTNIYEGPRYGTVGTNVFVQTNQHSVLRTYSIGYVQKKKPIAIGTITSVLTNWLERVLIAVTYPTVETNKPKGNPND